MPIEKIKIRARIEIGSFDVETPFILSFNVNRTRGQISTFDARIKIADGDVADMTGGPIKIYAGSGYAGDLIFTGIVKKVSMSPCFDDPHFILVNLSGADVLSVLQNKKYSRRCIATETSWATIDNVTRRGLKSSKFKYRTEPVVLITNSDIKETEQLISTANSSKKYTEMGVLAPQVATSGAKLVAEIQSE